MNKKLFAVVLALVLALGVFAGCTPVSPGSSTSSLSGTVTGRDGSSITLPEHIETIASGSPAATEILVGLGLGDKLVAVDTYSADVAGIKSDTPQFDAMSPDAEQLVKLSPSIIVASGMSQTGQTNDPYKSVTDAGICVIYIPTSSTIEDIEKDIRFIAEITGTKQKGEEIVSGMKAEIDKIAAMGKTVTTKKSVYFEIAPAPNIYTFGSGTFLNEMIEIIGAKNIFGDQSGWLAASGESVAALNPQVILTNVNYMPAPVDDILARAGWEKTDAVKNKDVYVIDANASSRPSQNIIKALKEMAKAVYPDLYKD